MPIICRGPFRIVPVGQVLIGRSWRCGPCCRDCSQARCHDTATANKQAPDPSRITAHLQEWRHTSGKRQQSVDDFAFPSRKPRPCDSVCYSCDLSRGRMAGSRKLAGGDKIAMVNTSFICGNLFSICSSSAAPSQIMVGDSISIPAFAGIFGSMAS